MLGPKEGERKEKTTNKLGLQEAVIQGKAAAERSEGRDRVPNSVVLRSLE